MKLLTGSSGIVPMTGDKEIDNTVWYDMIINQTFKTDENSKLATPLQKGAEEETKTSSTEAS